MKTRTIRTKLLSLLLAAIMVFSLLPVTALAATVDSTYTPGTYTGTAKGLNGDVTINVTLVKDEDGAVKISEITAEQNETPKYWAKAEPLLAQIEEKNGTDGVDAVSGATYSSKAIINATNEALSKANPAPSGSGTENDPYVIMNAAQLQKFAELVDGGETYEGKYVVLGADIDLSSVDSWNPIGAESGTANIFRGTFDGKGYSIKGLKINTEIAAEANYGLFSILGNQAIVKNVNVVGADIDITNTAAAVRAGVIAGDTEKTAGSGDTGLAACIDGCSAIGSVNVTTTGDKLAFGGGIVGRLFNGGTVTNCWTDVDITAKALNGSKSAYAGGIAGTTGNYAVIANCATFGDCTAIAPKNSNFGGMAGGIVSMLAGKQYNVYAIGDMTAGNGGSPHKWIGVLDGQVTTSGMTGGAYPAAGATRLHNYYNQESVLTIETYNADETLSGSAATDTVGCGLTTKSSPSYDTIMVTTPMAKAQMAAADFAEALNGNIKEINGILAAYGITGIALREWQFVDGRVLPTGNVWVPGEVDASIFASGDGTEESPYVIKTAAQLRAFAGSLNTKTDYANQYIKLGADIDVSDEVWQPIGGSSYLFNGTFDGSGYTISGMTLGSAEKAFKLDSENLYIGLFGLLGSKAYVKNVKVDVAFYTSYAATAYVGGIVGITQGSTTNGEYTGAVIDNCYVSGIIKHTAEKGNQFVGGIVGMQYKGAIINSAAEVDLSGVVTSGDLAEVGGLVGLNNRGLVANCRSDSTVYGSGNRDNGNEGMAVVSNLIACNAGDLVNCYASGDITTKEHSVYAGMVSGWVTGIGKSYSCWYDLNSTMIVGKDTDNPLTVKPVESIGTKVASGVTEEGDAYTGGLVDKMTGVNGTSQAVADSLNASFKEFPIDISEKYGLSANSLKTWVYEDDALDFGSAYEKVNYVKPDCETVVKPELKLNDGTWYGRDDEKTTVVSVEVENGKVIETSIKVIKGDSEGEAYDAALAKAKYKATYGDFSHYEAADVSKFGGGSGTADDPYIIANAEQLKYLSSSINADVSWSGVYFKQTADITLDGQWQPIGWALNGEVNGAKKQICAYPFRGNYDGGGYSISGLVIGSESAPADMMTAGLFGLTSGSVSSNAQLDGSEQTVTIKNVNLKNVYINVSTRYETYVGGLVGSAQNGICIDNCTVSGKVSSETSESFSRAGGLAGSILRGSVTNCAANVEVKGVTDTNHVYAGGFYGMDNRVTTYNCYALGNVYGSSSNNNKVHIGGFVGQAGGVHYNCYAAGSEIVSAKTTTDVGAFSGRNSGINVDYYCYHNNEALVKQGDTEGNKAVGVATTNTVIANCEGKTASELKSAEFAKLMTDNASAEKTAAANEFINDKVTNSASGLTQANYYTGNALFGWLADGSGYAAFCKHVGTVVTDEAVAATCTKTGLTEGKHCSDCGMVIAAQKETPKLDHSFKNGKCTECGAKDPNYKPPTPVHHHTVVIDAAVAATCTETGLTEGSHCATCNAVIKAQEIVPALGHKAELKNAKAATCTEAGYTGDKVCSVCGVTVEKGSELKALGHKFIDGVCSECGAKDPSYNPFKDVSKDAFYYDAVLWAAANDVTKGTSDTTFSPDEGCTRAQIVAFLYRAAGSPKVENVKNPFTDVSKNSEFYDAVMWAVSEGITRGTTATTFSPDEVCTRAQIVTFLYRASGDKVTAKATFNDVAASAWYAEAVTWAVANGITKGTGANAFSPDLTCTRAQAVTLIYRAQ